MKEVENVSSDTWRKRTADPADQPRLDALVQRHAQLQSQHNTLRRDGRGMSATAVLAEMDEVWAQIEALWHSTEH
jgi:hypothetical protein